MSWLHGTAARLRLLFARRSSESRIDSELQFHLEMETERLIRELALEPEEARRRALVTFGGVEKHREALRDGSGTTWLRGLSLDFRLGLRMLAKYPGLTFVGVLGMSVTVTIGAFAFTAVSAITGAALPLDEGDRVVAIENVIPQGRGAGRRTHLHDLAVWREALHAVEDLGAVRIVPRNLIAANTPPEVVRVAEMTASGFRVARVAPMVGRTLKDEDERDGAPDVVVIGYDLWQQRLGGRADILGSTVQLGAVRSTVIGVMPKGFAFPWNNQVWTPLRLNPTAYPHGDAPAINVFGRLSHGASLADARQQLTTIGQRLTAEYPKSHERIRPRVLPYTRTFLADVQVDGLQAASLLHLVQVVVGLLLVVIATNVAVLVYARTASRAGEMAVRTALGASRRRIVTQLFAEALVLSAVASVVGIVVAHFVFQRVDAMVQQSLGDQIPYWIRLEITPVVAVYVAGLAVLAAVIIGVIPGLKATRHRVSENLKDLSGGASMRLGRTWTTLLIAQVAVSVAALPIAMSGSKMWMSMGLIDGGTPVTKSFLIATPLLDALSGAPGIIREDASVRQVRYTSRVADLIQKLESEPGGIDVVRMSPASIGQAGEWITVDPISTTAPSDTVAIAHADWSAGLGRVDAEFFAAFELPMLTGRGFTAADFAPAAPAAIVNRDFVERILGDGHALGRHVRPARDRAGSRTGANAVTRPWWEIVGVVENFPKPSAQGAYTPMVYLPLRPADVYPMALAVRAHTLTPAAASDRIRMVAMSVDPTLRFTAIHTVDDLLNEGIEAQRLAVLGLVVLIGSVVLLSAAGIYALMSFTVTRRRREIGIRVALGAQRGRVLADVLSRAMRQIGIGIALGAVGTIFLAPLLGESSPWSERVVGLLQVIALMVTVGFIATVGPARRALRVQPTEALRAE